MSFSKQVKTELCALPLGKKALTLSEAYGAFLFGNAFTPREVRILTESRAFGSRLEALLHKALGFGFDFAPDASATGKRSYIIQDTDKLRKIADAIGYDPGAHLSHAINFGILEEPDEREAFVRGAFLAGGSVTDPEKGYHLELITSHRNVSRGMVSLLQEMGFSPKDTTRRGNYAIYFKQSDAIADLLTTLGASGSALAHMTAKVEKHMNNAVQRRVNCDAANVEKTVEAAQEQLDAIRRIEQREGLESLPEKLYQTALLRIVNPEMSLTDLAKLADPPVSKSCMSHRLRKLLEIDAKIPAGDCAKPL